MSILLEESWFWSQAYVVTNCTSAILLAVNPTSYLNFLSLNSLTYQKTNFTAWGCYKD